VVVAALAWVVASGCGDSLSVQVPDNREPLERSSQRQEAASHLLLITADTTRRDAVGPYGGTAATPALDRLAADGVIFDNAYTVALGTAPSHASLMTASPAVAHGVYDNESVLGDEALTLAEVLRSEGLATAAFIGAMPVSARLGFRQGFATFDQAFESDPTLGRFARHERRAERTVDRFLAWLEASGQRRFFAWIHFYDPHQPYCPASASDVAGGDRSAERFFVDRDGQPAYVRPEEIALHGADTLAAVDRVARQRYRREISSVDSQIARLVARLKADALYDRTLIVVASDHGENFLAEGQHLAFRHGGLGGAVTRLALIVKLPQCELAGSRSALLVGNQQLAPAMLEVLGIALPDGWAPDRILASLRGGRDDGGGFLVIEGAHRHALGVRTRRWAYSEPWHGGNQPRALFDLEADPSERSNLVDVEPQVVAELRVRLLPVRQRAPVARQTVSDERVLQALRELGYTQ
jgi:arylsulfatase A-like enzyme